MPNRLKVITIFSPKKQSKKRNAYPYGGYLGSTHLIPLQQQRTKE